MALQDAHDELLRERGAVMEKKISDAKRIRVLENDCQQFENELVELRGRKRKESEE